MNTHSEYGELSNSYDLRFVLTHGQPDCQDGKNDSTLKHDDQ